ncbi:Tubulin-specific chaperone A [Acorus calamus]|uniref:Tubulin-specific chaperone A n=1 Tax=Acorus calamus TaxID=4465 RepID=A0AAV9DTX5_ACOCL|nr:Tubulin-specific chaperone A [Acorus calamus]
MAILRNLKIKTGTCKRILKELHSYEKEVENEAKKTADMKDSGADPYDLKQQENVLAESRMMIPDCHKRLDSSLADLKGTLAELKEADEQVSLSIIRKNIRIRSESVSENAENIRYPKNPYPYPKK